MKALTTSRPVAVARRDKYYGLRREGMPPWEAAREVDVSDNAARRYERWYQAIERGEVPVPSPYPASPAYQGGR